MKKNVSPRCAGLNYFARSSWKTFKFIMRFSLIIFLGVIVSSQWLGASPLNGQSIESVKINLSVKNESLVQVFHRIEKQTSFRFMFRKDDVRHINQVSQQLNQVSLDQVLKAILIPYGLNYRQVGQRIMVVPVEKNDNTVLPDVLDDKWIIKGRVLMPQKYLLKANTRWDCIQTITKCLG